jgi:glycosyltransferase involved in cell wall biosynthesis
VETGLEAIRLLRARGLHCRVVRVSPLPLSLAERRMLPPDRYLSRAHPRRVARVLRGCDLLLFPSRAEEGFGLPALEAMASKVPVVASDIPSMGFIGGAVRVPPGRSVALADAAEQLLREASRWREAADRGLSAAQAFHPARVAPALEQAIEWARERALRSG